MSHNFTEEEKKRILGRWDIDFFRKILRNLRYIQLSGNLVNCF